MNATPAHGRRHASRLERLGERARVDAVLVGRRQWVEAASAIQNWTICARPPTQRRTRVLPWAVTLLGLAVSVAGNVGHVGWAAPVADKATAAVPPLAAAAALAVGR
jgi:hypothetical protein